VADNYAQVSGKRIFIQPNLLSKTTLKLADEDRKHEVDLIYGFCDIDSVEIKIPAGFTPEAMPQPLSLNSKFGNYKITYAVDADKISMTRRFERKEGRFPAADYKELAKLYGEMYKADRGKIVLIKQ
jgi:hypothetical protein